MATLGFERLTLSEAPPPRPQLPRACGRVGDGRSLAHTFVATRTGDEVHVRCLSNPEFWLSVDLASGVAEGYMRLAGVAHRADAHAFAVIVDGATVCVYHSACAAFWLELDL